MSARLLRVRQTTFLRRCKTTPAAVVNGNAAQDNLRPDAEPATRTTPPQLGSPSTTALASKTYGEVLRGWMVFKLLSYDWIVRKSMTLYSLSRKVLGARLTKLLLRKTVAGQFMGGFTEDEVKVATEKNNARRMSSGWNLTIEQYLSDELKGDIPEQEARFDEILRQYLESIQLAGEYNYQPCPVKLAAVKVTSMVNLTLLAKLSAMLVAVQQSKQGNHRESCELSVEGTKRRAEIAELMASFQLPEHLPRLQEISRSCGSSVTPFNAIEREQLDRFLARLDEMGQCAEREGVRLMVDAEESRVQPAICHLAIHNMMTKFNHTQPTIYDTVQMYLKDSFATLLLNVATAKHLGFSYGLKVVRGAYMVYERDLAAQLGHEYPVHASKEGTDMNYDRGIRYLLEEIARGKEKSSVGGLLVASHNRNSVEKAMQLIKALRLPPDDGTVCFGQMQGMADYLSHTLVDSGHFVHKIVVYGEESEVLPFLVRRAEENSRTSENARLERQLYGQELRRRHYL